MYIDCHCHLEKETYGADLSDVIARALQAGLTHLIAVGASRVAQGAEEVVRLAQRVPHVFAAVGIHPHDVAASDAEAIQVIDTLLAHPRVVSLGEVGLDYFYNHSSKDKQQAVLAEFMHMAKRHNKPIMLHIREAHDDFLKLVDAIGLPQRGGMIHCFTAGPKEAAAYLDRGFYLSIPGVVTFKSAESLREAIGMIPHNRLLLETDCPFLTPVPYRGKRNEPALMVHTAAAVAALLGLPDAAAIGRITSDNAIRFFNLPHA